ncbi:zinc-dependent metalloprotease [Nocardioides sp. TRM66260-LWL]|uniref:zinc-dependent metalloprotease n=1 Tax=Nocardioides sp. TRM66260-LWL TaxID=2874478 RepID=UPI001CC69337|nr:zinc-dependent metalloprotease [Nocardioides sp. TRM66260-LWL]MBZ5734842.1 zinc-dependent metalloprotease [Nocardioides sp. TRM66260-LWL]
MAADPAAMIDWDLAVSLGTRLAGEGPRVTRAEADAAVAELRAAAGRSTDLVRACTGLDAGERTAPLLVVDRGGWVQANADAFAHLLGPLVGRLTEKRPPSGLTLSIGSRITGAEVGGLLGFLASKVLGQFDPFHEPTGRLLLVAPNIVDVERQLDVDPSDFRLWVALHEETHRVQFTAVPWMRDHLQGLVAEVAGTVGGDATSLVDGGLARVRELLADRDARRGSLVELFSSPAQRELLDRVTAVMSLLEGHADVVMDDVGPTVIPTVAHIRERFTERRQGIGALDRLLRRLLGLEAKMAQYRDGARFVRGAIDAVGMHGFNAVWSAPEALPSRAEIADPAAWVARVHG